MFTAPSSQPTPDLPRLPVAPNPEWVPSHFHLQPTPLDINLVSLCNLGIYTIETEKVAQLYCDPQIAPVRGLTLHGTNSGAGFYSIDGVTTEVVIKPEVIVYPKIGKIGRQIGDLRHVIPVLLHLEACGLESERPLLWLSCESGRSYYGVARIEGRSLRAALPTLAPEDLHSISYKAGECLATWHRAGVLHGHPHDGNFFLTSDKVILIDAKAVTVKDEYPYTFRSSKRTRTWDEAVSHDLGYAARSFTAIGGTTAAELFLEGYNRR